MEEDTPNEKTGNNFFLVGLAILLLILLPTGAGGLFAFLLSPKVPIWVKVASFFIIIGLTLLFTTTAWETFRKKDKYGEIEK